VTNSSVPRSRSPVTWSETIRFRTRSVSDQQNRSWSWCWC